MKRASKTIETSSKRQHWRAQGTANEMSGMSTNVATLVVSVDCKVQPHQLDEVVILAIAKHVGKVESVVFVFLEWSNLAVFVDIAVYSCSNCRELGDQIHGIFKCVAPIVLFVDAFCIGLCELELTLQSDYCHGKLSHRVEVGGTAVDKLLDELGNIGSCSPVSREAMDLLLAWDLSCQEQPEKTLRQGLFSSSCLGKLLLAF